MGRTKERVESAAMGRSKEQRVESAESNSRCLGSANENSSFLSTNAAVRRGTDCQAPRDSVVKKVDHR